jgi:hypothetical protein
MASVIRQTLSILLFFLTLTACSSPMDKPALNPHPTQRYELTVTVDAPGPWDKVSASVTYNISNVECTPKNSFEGVHELPDDVDHAITLTRVNEHTYKGYFYRDLLEGGDYYGLGVCHWEMEGVGIAFLAHGLTFGTGISFYDKATGKFAIPEKPVTEYFSKKEYFDKTLKDQSPKDGMYMMSGSGSETPPFTSNFGEPFPVTMNVRETKP